MNSERNDYYRELSNLHDECKKSLYFHAVFTMTDGTTFDGIIEDVNTDTVTVLVGEEVMEDQFSEQRQYYSYGRPRRRFRRFRRRSFPLGNLAALALLPYVAPPPYPYFPYYF